MRRPSGRWLGGAAGAALGSMLLVASPPSAEADEPRAPITFAERIAPLLQVSCAPCHRPGGSGPFPLLTYDDARRRARQIAEVTRDGFMPPWLPAAGPDPFVGERRLDASAIELIERWVADGLLEGDPRRLPPTPDPATGWALGEPDLVLAPDEPFPLLAGGPDVYRNFVIPSPVDATRHVAAVEFRPSDPRVVHHARLLVDRTLASRALDARDADPGFDGMEWGEAETPDGILLGWTPGKLPLPARPGIAWRLDRETDLVLQLHMIPSGKPEAVSCDLGLHFADGPPTVHPFALVLGSRSIDIPAGAADYSVTESYTLPVDVELAQIYPHAHYLGKEMQVRAELPDGTARSLLHIPDWDFNWQDEYRYAVPVALPRGSIVRMVYTFDNSARNPRNPSAPPRRVRYGPRSTDEMAELMLELLTADPADREALATDVEEHRIRRAIAYRQERIEADPGDDRSHAALGSTYLHLGRHAEAIAHLERSLEIAPRDAVVENNLAYALTAAGQSDAAIAHYRRAVEIDPELAEAHHGLGRLLLDRGEVAAALEHLARAVELRPSSPEARAAWAEALARARQPDLVSP